MKKVLLSHTKEEIGPIFRPEALAKLQSFAQVVVNPYDRRMTTDELIEAAREVEAVITEWYTPGSAEFFDSVYNLKVFARSAERLINIDLGAATRNGIIVANVPEKYVSALVQVITGYMYCLAHGIFRQQAVLREKGEIIRTAGFDLLGKTAGLVGIGRIGREMAKMAASLGMKVLAFDPYVTDPGVPAEMTTLKRVLSESRFVIILCKLTPETTGLIGKEQIDLIRPDAYFINPARGAIVDEAALAQALHDGRIAGAAIDVFSDEPYVRSNPLMHAPNTIVTPHIAGHTVEAYLEESMGAVEAVEAVFSGRLPRHVANPEVLPVLLQSPARWSDISVNASALV